MRLFYVSWSVCITPGKPVVFEERFEESKLEVVRQLFYRFVSSENFSPPASKEGSFDFMMHTFAKATECDACGKLLAGCFYQGYLCSSKSYDITAS